MQKARRSYQQLLSMVGQRGITSHAIADEHVSLSARKLAEHSRFNSPGDTIKRALDWLYTLRETTVDSVFGELGEKRSPTTNMVRELELSSQALRRAALHMKAMHRSSVKVAFKNVAEEVGKEVDWDDSARELQRLMDSDEVIHLTESIADFYLDFAKVHGELRAGLPLAYRYATRLPLLIAADKLDRPLAKVLAEVVIKKVPKGPRRIAREVDCDADDRSAMVSERYIRDVIRPAYVRRDYPKTTKIIEGMVNVWLGVVDDDEP